MDTWLLLCMIFVALALFEYAFQLAIRYREMKRGSKKDTEEHEKVSKQRGKEEGFQNFARSSEQELQ